MTNERMTQLSAAVGPSTRSARAQNEAESRARMAAINAGGTPLAQRIAGDLQSGHFAPVTSVEPGATENEQRKAGRLDLADACQLALTREANRLRVRGLLWAYRQLLRSPDARDQRSAERLAAFARGTWGVEVWRGDPNCVLAGATPDEHCVAAAVRRVTR